MTKREQLDYMKEYRALRKRLKLCVECGKQDERTISGHSYCFSCAEKYRKLSKENYKNKSLEEKAEYNRRRKERWHKRKAEHRCPRCNKELETEYEYVICPSCREKALEDRRKAVSRNERDFV